MGTFYDPQHCPNCGRRAVAASCAGCGLIFGAPQIRELATLLQQADAQLTAIRGLPANFVAGKQVSAAAAPARGLHHEPPHHEQRHRAPSDLLSGRSTGTVLLMVGGLCLLVAGAVFAAWAWQVLGLAARALILGGISIGFAAGAEVTRRRGLRTSAEVLAAVAAGLWLVLAFVIRDALVPATPEPDVVAGAGARVDLALAGLVGAGAVAGAGALRRVRERLWAPDALGAIAVAWAANALLRSLSDRIELGLIALGLLVAACQWRLPEWRLRPGVGTKATCWLVGGVAIGVLEVMGLVRTAQVSPTFTHQLTSGWQVPIAVALVVLLAVVTPVGWRRRMLIRLAGLMVGAWLFIHLVKLTTATVLWWSVCLLGALAVLLIAHRRARSRPATVIQAALEGASIIPLAGSLAMMMFVVLQAMSQLALAPGSAFSSPSQASWLWAAALPTMALGIAPQLMRPKQTRSWWDTALLGLITLTLLAVATAPVVWWAIAAAAATGAAGVAAPRAAAQDRGSAMRVVAPVVAVGLLLALGAGTSLTHGWPRPIAWLAAALVSFGVAHWTARPPVSSGAPDTLRLVLHLGAGVIGLAALWAAWEAPSRLTTGQLTTARAISFILVGVLGILGSTLLQRRATAGTGRQEGRLAAEILGAAASGVAINACSDGLSQVAIMLTLLGAAWAGAALLTDDRRWYGWAGGVTLTAASWARLLDVGTETVELYTVPAALALTYWGWRRLTSTPSTRTLPLLGPGLSLGVLPSLVLALAEPLTLRAAAVGVVGVALMLIGVSRRWAAPFLLGAVSVTALALVELTPYVRLVPPWLLLAAAGAVLVGCGITWEARVADARRAGGYVQALR